MDTACSQLSRQSRGDSRRGAVYLSFLIGHWSFVILGNRDFAETLPVPPVFHVLCSETNRENFLVLTFTF